MVSRPPASPQLIQWTVRINRFCKLAYVHKIHIHLEATSPFTFKEVFSNNHHFNISGEHGEEFRNTLCLRFGLSRAAWAPRRAPSSPTWSARQTFPRRTWSAQSGNTCSRRTLVNTKTWSENTYKRALWKHV